MKRAGQGKMRKKADSLLLFSTFVCLMLILGACRENTGPQSPLFLRIFKDDTSTFRGMNLGMRLETIKNRETGSLKHDDELGFVYIVNLGEEKEMVVEYFKKPDAVGQEVNKLAGINADIQLRDEVVASHLYQEISNHFSRKYGVTEGQFGNNRWLSEPDSLEVSLRLAESKSDMSLFFVWMGKNNSGTTF